MKINRLLVHPVRSRIIACLSGRQLTRHQLAALIPETPPPSLYRNLRVLIDAGMVVTTDRIPRRGVEEHVYALVDRTTSVNRTEASQWSREEWQAGLDTFMQQISASYRAYLADGGDEPCPAAGLALVLTPEERDEMMGKLYELAGQYRDKPRIGRRRYIVSMIFQPDERPLPEPAAD